jgi:hypothetical protein
MAGVGDSMVAVVEVTVEFRQSLRYKVVSNLKDVAPAD